MTTLQILLFVIQVLVAITLIGFILVQHGKGADAGAAFGSGASSTVFGASGSGNFMTKATAVLVTIFLANSLGLAYLATHQTTRDQSLLQQQQSTPMKEGPVSIPSKPDAPITGTTEPTGTTGTSGKTGTNGTSGNGGSGSDIPAIPKD